MEYNRQFKDLVNDERWENQYIGVGNPNAKILIVGKECAIDPKEQSVLYDRTFLQNWKDWHNNINNDIYFDSILEWQNDEEIFIKYNPLWPFYKQRFKRLKKLKDGSFNGGTSNTWFNYQKVFNLYRKRIGVETNSEYIDFFKDCFITELSDICRPNNNNLSKDEKEATKQSISKRYDLINGTPFFKRFDVVIMVCGGYADKLNTDLMFGRAKVINTNPLNGHRLPQLSFCISDKLLESIAEQL